MAEQPRASIPKQAESWSQTLATYRFLHNDRVRPEAIQRGAIKRTRQSCSVGSVVLCLHDLTELKPAHPMSETKLLQHTVLAVSGEAGGDLHGVLHQRWFDDPRTPRGESRAQRRARWTRSQVWPEAVEAVGRPTSEARWITVADREADDFQVFHACRDAGQGFVIRVQHDRYVDERERLHAMIRRQPIAGGMSIEVSRRGKVGEQAPPRRRRPTQKARRASVLVRYAAVMLQPPRNDPRYDEPFAAYAVQAQEIDPPDDVASPIDWLLLTSEPVTCLEEALTVIGWYRRRWLIEEFHKAQKTGCRLERTQLESPSAFIRLAAITALGAVRLLELREKADDAHVAEEPAMKHVDPLWVQVVSRVAKHDDPSTLTMRQFYHTIARQGGWLGRRGDGRPGWQALWHGWQRIASYVQGIQLMRDAPP